MSSTEKNLLKVKIKEDLCKICKNGNKKCYDEIACFHNDFSLFEPLPYKESRKILKKRLDILLDNYKKLKN